ncbi:MAG: hypothetical protein ACOC5T_09010 [Elusimicrobiota bacterium]
MKKPITALLIIAVLALTAGYNLQSKASTKPLDDQELAELEGGMSLVCIGAVAAAGALAATGPGFIVAVIAGIVVACSCDDELDSVFGTNFVEACNPQV